MNCLKFASQTTNSRVLLVAGAKSTGKTTFVCSASKYATDDVLPLKTSVECSDVVLVQNDTGGSLGPLGLGLEPLVVDLSGAKNKVEWDKLFNEAYKELYAGFSEGKFRILGIDLTALDKLLREQYVMQSEKPQPQDWERVTSKARAVYVMLRALPNVTLVGMTHLAVKTEMINDPALLQRAHDALDAVAVGGERSVTTYALTKGHKEVWTHNADQVFVMRRQRAKGSGQGATYSVRLEGNSKVEAGGRWRPYFDADEQPAHLGKLMKKVYGDKA